MVSTPKRKVSLRAGDHSCGRAPFVKGFSGSWYQNPPKLFVYVNSFPSAVLTLVPEPPVISTWPAELVGSGAAEEWPLLEPSPDELSESDLLSGLITAK